jgi:RNA polymerase sigma-70 factor (ECF subfamily)
MRAEVVRAIEELQKNRPESVERALELLQDTVFAFSLKVCGHREDAEDTMQETLLKVTSALPQFSDPRALAVWLYKVAKTRCLMSRRSKFAPKEQLSLEVLMPDRAELERLMQAEETHPERALLASEAGERIRQAVQKLPPEYRLALVLHDMEELSTEEIARVMGLREGTVRVRLHRARVFVRNALAKGGDVRKARKKAAAPRPGRCKKLFAQLSDYLDGELPVTNCEELEKHLEDCAPCQTFVKSLESTVETLQRQKARQLDPKVAARTRIELLDQYQRALDATLEAQQKPAPRR